VLRVRAFGRRYNDIVARQRVAYGAGTQQCSVHKCQYRTPAESRSAVDAAALAGKIAEGQRNALITVVGYAVAAGAERRARAGSS